MSEKQKRLPAEKWRKDKLFMNTWNNLIEDVVARKDFRKSDLFALERVCMIYVERQGLLKINGFKSTSLDRLEDSMNSLLGSMGLLRVQGVTGKLVKAIRNPEDKPDYAKTDDDIQKEKDAAIWK